MNYILKRKKIKNIYLRVLNNKIYVTAPFYVSKKKIDNYVLAYKKKISNNIKTHFFKEKQMMLFGLYIEAQEDIDLFLRENLEKYIEKILPIFKEKLNINEEIKISFKRVKSYLGQFNKKENKITLNILIAHLDKNLIDYVLLHELSHFYYQNHSQEYWSFLEKSLPNYKQLRKRIKKEFYYYDEN